jgi:hypothetical protein
MNKPESSVHSSDLLERIVRNSFKRGENWAKTYGSWFNPEPEDTEHRIKAALKSAKRVLRSNTALNGANGGLPE